MTHALHQASRTSILALSAALVFTIACQKNSSGAASSAAMPSNSQPDHNAPITEAPIPPPVTANPLKGAKLFVVTDREALRRLGILKDEVVGSHGSGASMGPDNAGA